jgi:hypothetical protein
MQTTRQGAQLGKPGPELLHRLGEGLRERGVGGGVEMRLGRAQHQPDRGEALLRAVVQVALQAAPSDVGRLDDPRLRVSQLSLGGLAFGDVAKVSGEGRRTSMRVIVTSRGNVVPSARMPVISRRRFSSTGSSVAR